MPPLGCFDQLRHLRRTGRAASSFPPARSELNQN